MQKSLSPNLAGLAAVVKYVAEGEGAGFERGATYTTENAVQVIASSHAGA